MAVLGQNLCEPPRIYGPVAQTLLCGCSIKSFSVSAGWNEQSSSLSVELVPDTECIAPKIWWDEKLNRHQESIADPGFTYPEPGCAIYFRIEENPDGNTEAERGGFEYCGILESWNEKKGPEGNPIYSVSLRDPRAILESSQIIVNDYPGDTEGVFNLINVYGYVESLGSLCLVSPALGIGGITSNNTTGSITNERGMVWNDVRCAIQTLTSSSIDTGAWNSSSLSKWCRDGRLVFAGPSPSQEGYGVIQSDDEHVGNFLLIPNVNKYKNHYLVDLSEIPMSANSYRISGPTISLAELITQVCQDVGADYYCELLPVKAGNKVYKIIKIRVALRSNQLQLGRIDDFIESKKSQATEANGGILNYVKGEEVRNEETSIYLMGSHRLDPLELDSIVPFWGLDSNGELILASGNVVRIDISRLNLNLFYPFASQYIWINEYELRGALSEQDTFELMVHYQGAGDLLAHYNDVLLARARYLQDNLAKAINGLVPAVAAFRGFPDDETSEHKFNQEYTNDKQKIFEFIKNYSSEFYGKQFLVIAPIVCYAVDNESQKLKFSHEPSTEGCWVNDATPTVLGLQHNTSASDFFRDDTGKYNPIMAFPRVAFNLPGTTSIESDPSKLNSDNYITDAIDFNWIWTKAHIEKEWVFGLPSAPSANTISFLLKIDAPVLARWEPGVAYPNVETNALRQNFIGGWNNVAPQNANAAVFGADRKLTTGSLEHAALRPYAALCPVKNNVQVYGPWGVAGLPGQVRIESDEGFNPWEYGSDVIMNQAALSKVSQAVTQMRKGERGSILVAGYPNIPLGAELMSVDSNNPPNSQKLQKYVGTRSYNVGTCASVPAIYCEMNQWTGEFGPNVTNVNVQVGDGGFTTEYQFSTYTPAFGRFSKGNAEKLKRIGQQRLSSARNLRARATFQAALAAAIQSAQVRQQTLLKQPMHPDSAHHILMGNYAGDGTEENPFRPNVFTQTIEQMTYGFVNDATFLCHSYASWDSIFRPVVTCQNSAERDEEDFPSELAGLVQYELECGVDRTRQSDPPIDAYTRLEVSRPYVDPFQNPGRWGLGDRVAEHNHDFQVLGRGKKAPYGGWREEDTEFAKNYRVMALRGPLLIQQWGYDEDSKPVPNEADSENACAEGIFTSENLTDKFLEDFLQKPKTWPVALLDLRLDRTRGVWTVPQPPRNVHVEISECGTSGPLQNIRDVYDAGGAIVEDKNVEFEWPWGITQPSGLGITPLYYDNVDCKYYAFPVNRLDVWGGEPQYGASGASGANGCEVDPENPFSSDPCGRITKGALQKYKDIKTLEFGEGLVVTEETDDCGNSKAVIKAIQGMICASGWDTAGGGGGVVFSGMALCGASSPSFNAFRSRLLVAGTGIQFTSSTSAGGECRSTISSAIFASGNPLGFKSCGDDDPQGFNAYNDDLETPQGAEKVNQIFSTLSFVGRLSTTVDPNNNCAVIVSGLPSLMLLSGIPGCNSSVSNEAFHSAALAVGSGLDLLKNSQENSSCYGTIQAAPIQFRSADIDGQRFTNQPDCSAPVSEDDSPRDYCNTQGGMPIAGPYKERKKGKYLTEIIAGNGIGITTWGAESNCSILLFNNHRDEGLDGDCQPYKVGQVGKHVYSPDFKLNEASGGGGAIDDFDASLATEISLNEGGGAWGISYVKQIKVTYGRINNTPVVTCVSWECGELNGTKSCQGEGAKHWITEVKGGKDCIPPGYPGSSGCSGPTGPTGGGGTSPVYTVISSNTTASANSNYAADTSGGSFTLTLPSSPTAGDAITVVDMADFTVNNLTVARNGSTIEGYSDDLICDIKGCVYTLIYDGTTWELSANLGGDGGTSSS